MIPEKKQLNFILLNLELCWQKIVGMNIEQKPNFSYGGFIACNRKEF